MKNKIKTFNEQLCLFEAKQCICCGDLERTHWQSTMRRDCGFFFFWSAKMENSSHHSLIYCFTQRQHKLLEELQQWKVTGCVLMLLLPPLWTKSPHRVVIQPQLMSKSLHNMLGRSQCRKKTPLDMFIYFNIPLENKNCMVLKGPVCWI